MARFMYGRNGGDRLGLATIWTAIVIDVVCLFIKGYQVPYLILSTLSTAMVLPYFFVTFLNSSFIFLRLSRAAALCGAVNELTEGKLYKQAEYYYHQRPCKKIDCLKIYL